MIPYSFIFIMNFLKGCWSTHHLLKQILRCPSVSYLTTGTCNHQWYTENLHMFITPVIPQCRLPGISGLGLSGEPWPRSPLCPAALSCRHTRKTQRNVHCHLFLSPLPKPRHIHIFDYLISNCSSSHKNE